MKLAIFDMDGTLIDSQAHITTAMAGAFGALNIATPPRETVLSVVGLSLPQAMFRLAPEADEITRDRLVEAYKDSFAGQRAQSASPLYDGAESLLKSLKAETPMTLAIATGKSRRGLNHVLSAHGIAQHFDSTQVADDHPSKPHPSMIEAILLETAHEAGQAVMIGDTTYDIDMGRAAGVRTIGVTWGYHPRSALEQSGADVIVETMAALKAILLEQSSS